MSAPWIDISYPIVNGVPQWPGDPPIRMSRLKEIGTDSLAQVTKLEWLSHFMTHVDAPAHFIAGGASIVELGLDHWSGDAVVVEVDGDLIEDRHVPEKCEGLCVLFKTRNFELFQFSSFQENYVYVSAQAARLLAARKAKLVGVDYMSVDRYGDNQVPAHYALLGAGITILENIDLRTIAPGNYELVAFPLKIVDCDGSPVRAALRSR
jgi:arylformamidase